MKQSGSRRLTTCTMVAGSRSPAGSGWRTASAGNSATSTAACVAARRPSQGVNSGGVVAAPVFAKIAEQTVRYLNLEPTENEDDKKAGEHSEGAEEPER